MRCTQLVNRPCASGPCRLREPLPNNDEDWVRNSRRGPRLVPGRLRVVPAHVRHSMLAGVIHGAVLLTAVGAVLGLDARRVSKGLPIGALAGIGGALPTICSSQSSIGGPTEWPFPPPG